MKVKLTHSEYTALFAMFFNIVLPANATTIEDIMEKAILMQVYQKLHNASFPTKKKYSFKFDEAQQAAFYRFWQRHQFSNAASYEANLIRQITNSIHQKIIVYE